MAAMCFPHIVMLLDREASEAAGSDAVGGSDAAAAPADSGASPRGATGLPGAPTAPLQDLAESVLVTQKTWTAATSAT